MSLLGVADGSYYGIKRPIVDLSAPHNNAQTSLNLINKEEYSLSYDKLDDTIHEIVHRGQGLWLCKTDTVDAFEQIPIHTRIYMGSDGKGSYYFNTRLNFGSRSSLEIFDWLSQAICWIVHHNNGNGFILHLLDDCLTIAYPGCHGRGSMALLILIFNRLLDHVTLNKQCRLDIAM